MQSGELFCIIEKTISFQQEREHEGGLPMGGRAVYFDTHAHYDADAFDGDRHALLPELYAGGVELIIDPGCDVKSSRAAVELAEEFPFVYAAAGIHPEELSGMADGDLEIIRELAAHEKCVAIGEIGLDYYWDPEHREEQKSLFARQLELALKLDMPVIIHDREAHADTLEVLSAYSGLRGVFHCYSGSAEMAKELIKRGWYIGFDGPITFKNARRNIETLEICPLDRILIETDSPYLTPVPKRGKRNNSRNLCYIAEKIAEVKGIGAEDAARITLENGRRLFGV